MGLFKDCGCGCNGKKQQDKLITSIISGLTFFESDGTVNRFIIVLRSDAPYKAPNFAK